jgi:AcrR family transcriptional regulator
MPETRRERLRRELTKQILDVASQQLAERGPGGVSWRGIAREVGMNPASLYTYFEGMDALYTALIVRGFDSLADAVRTAADGAANADPLDHVVACANAYRSWAVANPAQFNLIFSDQIPGYAAPPGGPTVDAETAALQPLTQAASRVYQSVNTDTVDLDELPLDEHDRHMMLYGLLHGLVSLEVNHHFPPGVDHGARFEHRLRRGLEAELNAHPPASRTSRKSERL